MSKFSKLGLDSSLVASAKSLGWKEPTKIQEMAIPAMLEGKDVLALALTGSGKTGAFVLPVLQELLNNPSSGVMSCLILGPTRELVVQIGEVATALGASLGARCVVLTGGSSTLSQAAALARKPHIVVATPGRVLWHMTNTTGINFDTVRTVILDEADKLLSANFEPALRGILQNVAEERRTGLFSATLTPQVDKLVALALRPSETVRCDAMPAIATVSNLAQYYAFIPLKSKDAYLTQALDAFFKAQTRTDAAAARDRTSSTSASAALTADVSAAEGGEEVVSSSVIVFVDTIVAVTKTALLLRDMGFGAVPLHGKMQQNERLAALHRFRAGRRAILVATDVAARGLDIPAVDFVVNVGVPGKPKDYVHRVGRTARAGARGSALTLVTQYDVELFQRVEDMLDLKMTEWPLLDHKVAAALGTRVAAAQRNAAIRLKELKDDAWTTGSHRGRRGGDDDRRNPQADDDYALQAAAGALAGRKRKGGGGGGGGKRKGRR
jgi:ATP-dependent RNA helicase DDX47/RRP3